jgi:two-component system phosphate regulon sensor histidine kinase PhoR
MARPRRLIRQLLPSYLAIAILSLAGVEWYALTSLDDFYLNRTVGDLEDTGRLVRRVVAASGDRSAPQLQELAGNLERETGVRVTLLAPDGRVVADSRWDPAGMDDHGDRPEILAALAEGVGRDRRESRTLGEDSLYLALAPEDPGGMIVRASRPVKEIAAEVRQLQWGLALAGLIAALGVFLVSIVMARRIGRPIQRITEAAERFAEGDFGHRLEEPEYQETRALAKVLNRMAGLLDERFQTISRQHGELEGVLRSMGEAVIVLDEGGEVLRINRAAGEFLGVDPGAVRGRPLEDVVEPRALAVLLADVLASGDEAVQRDVNLPGPGAPHLLVDGSPLRDETGARIGAVIVIRDVTRLRRLEDIRADFVSNVSHELKTPITSLKGFVETLRDGALEDPLHARRFLDIIGRETDRLAAIIEDLVNLSRFEDGAGSAGIERTAQPLAPVLRRAVLRCQPLVRERGGRVELSCPADLRAEIAAPLLEMAVTNLVDNALKYGGPRPEVRVSAVVEGGEVVIRVRDRGLGIAPEHQPRVFERFYRVDKARSRADGGTGLGLALVKHIVRAQHGRVRLQSVPGEGSTFALCFPAPSSNTDTTLIEG